MSTFRRPQRASTLGDGIRRHPSLFGIPFLIVIVGASFLLQNLTQVRYDVEDGKKRQLSHDEALGLSDRKRRVDVREEYFRMQSIKDDDWEIVRVPRPKGVPEWGVPPSEKER